MRSPQKAFSRRRHPLCAHGHLMLLLAAYGATAAAVDDDDDDERL